MENSIELRQRPRSGTSPSGLVSSDIRLWHFRTLSQLSLRQTGRDPSATQVYGFQSCIHVAIIAISYQVDGSMWTVI